MGKISNIIIASLLFVLCVVLVIFGYHYNRLKIKIDNLKSRFVVVGCAPEMVMQSRAINIIKHLSAMDVCGLSLVRVGRNNDGGYVMANEFDKYSAAYSFGISDDVSWDMDVAQRGIDTFMYDHTIDGLPEENEHFKFFKMGICGVECKENNLKTFCDILTANNHLSSKTLVLKIDVEGAEWDAFNTTSSDIIDNFSQIVVEFHGVNNIRDDSKYQKMLSVFKKLNSTHQVIHVHANNYGSYSIIAGVPLPETFEVTYIRKRDHEFCDSKICFPISGLDMPNNPRNPDFFLGFYGASVYSEK